MEKSCLDPVRELEMMISEKAYREKCMHGILYVMHMIEIYDRQQTEVSGKRPVQMIDYRMKSAESIAGKLKKKGYEVSRKNAVDGLSDLAGVRVICFSEKDVYSLDEFLESRGDIAIIRRKDYIKSPKENGYRSLHLITEIEYPAQKHRRQGEDGDMQAGEKVRVEVQLRTSAMHLWAEMDHRQFYKKLTK